MKACFHRSAGGGVSLIKCRTELTIVQAQRGKAIDNVRNLFREYADSLHGTAVIIMLD